MHEGTVGAYLPGALVAQETGRSYYSACKIVYLTNCLFPAETLYIGRNILIFFAIEPFFNKDKESLSSVLEM